MESLVKLSVAAVASETTSMDFLTWAGNTDITKRTLGTMVFQDSSSYGTIAANDLVYLKSVAINLPSIFSVTTSTALPANPNLVAVLASQTANRVFASPNGSNGTPTFRSLLWVDISDKPTIFAPSAHTHTIGDITDLATSLAAKQPLDADLTAIAALSGASGLPRKTALNTWVLDTATYLTANQNITVSGDATGSGTTAITLTLASIGTAGTYRSVTVDAKGRVTAGTNPTTMAGYGLTADFATQWNAIWNEMAIDGVGNLYNIVAQNGHINSFVAGNFAVDGTFTDGNWSNGIAGQFLQSFGTYTAWTTLTTALISDFTANVLGQTLDGFVVGSVLELSELDTILSAFQNLQAQILNKLETAEIANYWKNGGNDVTADWSFGLNDATSAVHDFYWSVNSVEKMRLTAAGNLGVGITAPEAVIHAHAIVVGNAEVIALKASNEVSATSFFSIGINASNNRTNLYAGGEVWATTISKWKFGAADVVGVWDFQTLPISSVAPTAGNHLTNKTYVDSLAFVKRGNVVKTISLTNITLSGTQTVNGVALVANDLILVAGQTTGANNGVYVVAAGAWTRSTTNDADAEIRGAYHFITNGTYANQRFINTNASAITVGTTAITYGIDFGAETDPVWVAFRDANAITSTSITNWNTAFGWGNHASAGYVNITGDQTITGNKTFSSTLKVLALADGTSDFKVNNTFNGIDISHNNNLIWQIAKAGQTGHFGFAMGGSSSLTFALFHKGLRLGLNNSTFIKPTEILDVVGNITITGVLKINTVAPTAGQFLRATSDTVMAWAGLTVADIPDLSATYLNTAGATSLFTLEFNAKIAAAVVFGSTIAVAQTGFFYGNTNPTTNATGVLLSSNGTTARLRSFNPSTALLKPLEIDGSTINIKVNGVNGVNGTVFKSNGTVNSWASLTVADITNIATTYQAKLNGTGFVKSTNGTISYDTNTYLTALDAVTIGTFEGERGFKLFSDANKTYADGLVFTNPDTGILGIHAYGLANDGSTITQFGLHIDQDGLLYHRKVDGNRARILTTDDSLSGGGIWTGGTVSTNLDFQQGKAERFLDRNGSVTHQQYSSWTGEDIFVQATTGEHYISASKGIFLDGGISEFVYIDNVAFDVSNAAILSGGNAKFSITSLGGGRYKATLIAG